MEFPNELRHYISQTGRIVPLLPGETHSEPDNVFPTRDAAEREMRRRQDKAARETNMDFFEDIL